MNQFYAGIGSRQTPIGVRAVMHLLAAHLGRQGHILRSGGAEGADTAFEQGCNEAGGQKEIFLPWSGFNDRRPGTEPGVYCIHSGAAFAMAEQFHPNWAACSPGAQRLHARNCMQILGRDLNQPVSDVVCWTPEGKGGGGTGQALRIARAYGIPILDLGHHPTFLEIHEFLGLRNISS